MWVGCEETGRRERRRCWDEWRIIADGFGAGRRRGERDTNSGAALQTTTHPVTPSHTLSSSVTQSIHSRQHAIYSSLYWQRSHAVTVCGAMTQWGYLSLARDRGGDQSAAYVIHHQPFTAPSTTERNSPRRCHGNEHLGGRPANHTMSTNQGGETEERENGPKQARSHR